jgi:hypothetical protein
MINPPQQLLDDLMDGEKAYPIFDVRARWSRDFGNHNVETYGPKWFEGLPEGRLWDSTGWSKMPREEIVSRRSIMEEEERVWWPEYKATDKMQEWNPADLTITVEFRRWETWCMSWFSHWTWDLGLDDGQVLQSFERYVDRTEQLNRKEGEVVNGHFQEPYCLMGAEDRYRWHGRTVGKGDDEQTDAPCRCPCCKERGVVSVDH